MQAQNTSERIRRLGEVVVKDDRPMKDIGV